MLSMVVTLPTFHEDRSLLKVLAPLNIDCMFETRDTSQVDRSWLKSPAARNMLFMVLTSPTFHEDRSRLKLTAK